MCVLRRLHYWQLWVLQKTVPLKAAGNRIYYLTVCGVLQRS